MPFIIRIAKINKLFDILDERKHILYPISSLGGVGIITGLAISLLLVSDFTLGNSEFQYYLVCFFIIFILGVIDDIFVLHPLKRFSAEIVPPFYGQNASPDLQSRRPCRRVGDERHV